MIKKITLFLLLFFTCELLAQVENDKINIIARPDQSLSYTQIQNLLKRLRRDRYHVYEDASIDSLMISGSVWKGKDGNLKYMDDDGRIWILNSDGGFTSDTNNINIDSLLTARFDSLPTYLVPGDTLNRWSAKSHIHSQTDITNLKDTIQQVRTLVNGKANLSHTHIFGDVTGLKDSLQQIRTLTNGKANTVHTHTITDVSGIKDTIQQVRTLTNSKLNIVDTTNKWSAKDHTHTGILTTTFAPLYINGNTIGIVKAGTSGDGFLSAADWNTFFNKASSNHTHTGLISTANSPLSYSGGTLSILQANTNRDGFLSSTDWNSFNGKVSGSGLINYYAMWDGAKLLKHSNLYESGVGNLMYNGIIQSNGLFVNGNFQLQGDFTVLSHEVNFYDSPLGSNSYIVVASPRPASASDGDIVAKRFVAYTNTSKAGITTTITVSTPSGNKLIEIVGGIITSITP
jgi:hypothetical protein